MPKKRLISILLLIIASLYAFFNLTQQPQETTIEILPKDEVTKNSDLFIKDQPAPTAETKTDTTKIIINDSIDNKKSKLLNPLEISGTIANKTGEGIAGVLIYSNGEFPPTYSNATGQYRVVFEKSGLTELLFNFSFSGYQKQKNSIALKAFEQSPILTVDVTLTEALDTKTTTSVSGKISDLNGEGVANQQIHLITLGDYSENEVRYFDFSRTDDRGHFTLKDVSINTRYTIVVLPGNGYPRTEVDDVLVTNDTPNIDIILEDDKLMSVSGQVIDRDGVPLPNFNLSAKNISNDRFNVDLVTDVTGMFKLDNFPEGSISFSINSPAEFEITGIELSEMNTETIIVPVDIGSHFVTGLVTNNDGEIIEGALVTMQSTYSINGVDSVSIRYLKTDSSGAFTFEKFGSDTHFIDIASIGFKQQSIVHDPNSFDTNLNIVLDRL